MNKTLQEAARKFHQRVGEQVDALMAETDIFRRRVTELLIEEWVRDGDVLNLLGAVSRAASTVGKAKYEAERNYLAICQEAIEAAQERIVQEQRRARVTIPLTPNPIPLVQGWE